MKTADREYFSLIVLVYFSEFFVFLGIPDTVVLPQPNLMPPKYQPSNSQIFKVFWRGLKPQAGLFSFVLISAIISSVLSVWVPIFYKNFFDIIQAAVQASPDRNLVAPALLEIITIIALIHLIQWVIYRVAMFAMNFVESQTMAELRQNAFNHIMLHSHSFFADNFTGGLVQKIGRFSRAFDKISDTIIFQAVPLIVVVVGSVAVTFTLAPLISFIILLWVVFFFTFNLFYSKKMLKYDIASATADSKTGGVLADAISNHEAVTNFVGYNYEKEGFKSVTQEQARKSRKSWDMREISTTLQTFLIFVVEFIVFYYAIRLWQRDAITVGTFVLIQIYVIGVANQLWQIGRIIRAFYESMADSREMVEMMVLPYEITDIPEAKNLEIKNAEIDLKGVSFRYNGKHKEVLRAINLSIAHGEKVGLIGPSGAGKTTITRLLLRLHNASDGAVYIDGQDISKVTQESLRENISLVPQDPVLFHRSLLENIRYGRRNATDEEVISAAKLAHCDEFIDVLPDKYKTLVGERGIKLSGGERQRIAIARAILKNAPILILDEATSSLDSHSESLIQEALDTLMRGRTSIVIAHRLSTIRKMDRIIVMENGAILEEGTHSSLIKNEKSLYKKLWDMQMGGFINS